MPDQAISVFVAHDEFQSREGIKLLPDELFPEAGLLSTKFF